MKTEDIEGAELTIYYHGGQNISFDLTATQLTAVSKVLGLRLNDDGSFTCFSDEGVKQFMDITVNRFKQI